jgi:hypothetical protein
MKLKTQDTRSPFRPTADHFTLARIGMPRRYSVEGSPSGEAQKSLPDQRLATLRVVKAGASLPGPAPAGLDQTGQPRVPRVAALAVVAVIAVVASVLQTTPALAHQRRVLAGRSYKPIRNWMATTDNVFTSLRWPVYSGRRAVGVGRLKSCTGPGGGCEVIRRARVQLGAPRRICGKLRFSRLHLRGETYALSPICSLLYYQGPVGRLSRQGLGSAPARSASEHRAGHPATAISIERSARPPAWTRRHSNCSKPLSEHINGILVPYVPGKPAHGYGASLLIVVAHRHVSCREAKLLATSDWVHGHAHASVLTR